MLRILNEPTSAALSYGLDHGDPQKLLVYDLGGYDRRITGWILDSCQREHRVNLSRDMAALLRVREAAEAAKKELSTAMSAQITLPYIATSGREPLHLEMALTQEKFQERTGDLTDRTEGPVRQAISDVGLAPSDIGRVLLVGGSTRMPAVQEKVRLLTGKLPSHSVTPDECAAIGAASGVPQIDVTFDIDANGILTVSAQNQVSGKMKFITFTASDRMTQGEVMQAGRRRRSMPPRTSSGERGSHSTRPVRRRQTAQMR